MKEVYVVTQDRNIKAERCVKGKTVSINDLNASYLADLFVHFLLCGNIKVF